jgi:hypothetical protein
MPPLILLAHNVEAILNGEDAACACGNRDQDDDAFP